MTNIEHVNLSAGACLVIGEHIVEELSTFSVEFDLTDGRLAPGQTVLTLHSAGMEDRVWRYSGEGEWECPPFGEPTPVDEYLPIPQYVRELVYRAVMVRENRPSPSEVAAGVH